MIGNNYAINRTRHQVQQSPHMASQRNHAFRERQSLALNSAIAERLRISPDEVIGRARATLARWKGMPGVWCVDLGKWEKILADGSPNEIYAMLTGGGELSIRLRQSSPFSVQLDPKERVRILRESASA